MIVFNTRPVASPQTAAQVPSCAATPGAFVNFLVKKPPQPLPVGPFFDAGGAERRFSDYRERGLVVNFWATWCAPCVKEMPDLDRLNALLKAEGIEVLSLSSDREGAAVVERFYRRIGIKTLPILLDRMGALGREMKVAGLPTTILADRQGREVARIVGAAAWDSDKVVETIRRCLGGPSTPASRA
ncbi:MAG: TlpA family protein disulfide reductase [Alphaproteobacteria bacterium]|nr:TlpA family protein disulfide reductase [Alphaproteobacteria bacterium]